MTKLVLFLLVLMMCSFGVSQAQEWRLVWSDEFDGDALDLNKWSYQLGDGTEVGLPSGWGNNEWQYYKQENAAVSDGFLTITARKENAGGKNYTSARIRTKGKGDWKYGRIEIRAKMPIGQGLWPALWMLPTDNVYGGWAASGEIDIVEYLGQEPNIVHGTLHFGGEWPNNKYKGKAFTLSTGSFHDDFHDFALEWEEGEIRWYVDGELYQTQGEGDWWSSGGEFPAPFDQRFHLIFNLAVGGAWAGYPDDSTVFPQELVVDYVRVYQKTGTRILGKTRTSTQFQLLQNYPNPFNAGTLISYFIPNSSNVLLDVFDSQGRKIRTLVNSMQTAGMHTVAFDAWTYSSGFYWYRLRACGEEKIRRMLLLK